MRNQCPAQCLQSAAGRLEHAKLSKPMSVAMTGQVDSLCCRVSLAALQLPGSAAARSIERAVYNDQAASLRIAYGISQAGRQVC